MHNRGRWVGWLGWVVGNSWRGSCIWHAGVCRIPVGRDTPICIKSLFLRFLKAPLTSKVKQAETNEYIKHEIYAISTVLILIIISLSEFHYYDHASSQFR